VKTVAILHELLQVWMRPRASGPDNSGVIDAHLHGTEEAKDGLTSSGFGDRGQIHLSGRYCVHIDLAWPPIRRNRHFGSCYLISPGHPGNKPSSTRQKHAYCVFRDQKQ
jgi:hypothetical protein